MSGSANHASALGRAEWLSSVTVAVWPWAGYLTSLYLGCFNSPMEIVIMVMWLTGLQ